MPFTATAAVAVYIFAIYPLVNLHVQRARRPRVDRRAEPGKIKWFPNWERTQQKLIYRTRSQVISVEYLRPARDELDARQWFISIDSLSLSIFAKMSDIFINVVTQKWKGEDDTTTTERATRPFLIFQ